MAQNITVAGASIPNVPAVAFPKTDGSGDAVFIDAPAFVYGGALIDLSKAASGETYFSGGTVAGKTLTL